MMTDQERAKTLLMNRAEGFSILRLIRRSWRRYFLNILAAIALSTIAFTENGRMKYFYTVAFGISFGVLLRDVASLHRSKKDWGFWTQIMDWKKIEEITEVKDRANKSSEPSGGKDDEPLQQFSTQSLSITPGSLTLPQLLVAGLGFVAGVPASGVNPPGAQPGVAGLSVRTYGDRLHG